MEQNNIDCNLTHPNLKRLEELEEIKFPQLTSLSEMNMI